MSRKFKKGYFVQGQFVAEGSELDLELKRELKGGDEPSRTDLKKESDELQKLGESLLDLRPDLMAKVDLPEKLVDAVADAKRITNFEGKRRQMQFIGKQMRLLSPETLQAVREALDIQRLGSAKDTQALHLAEAWRDRLIADDAAVGEWLEHHPQTDIQQLRALVRQALLRDRAEEPAVGAHPSSLTPTPYPGPSSSLRRTPLTALLELTPVRLLTKIKALAQGLYQVLVVALCTEATPTSLA